MKIIRLKKMKSFCEEHQIETIYHSHHGFPLSPALIDNYIRLCDQVINKEIEGIYRDTGTCDGLFVSDGKISLIYKDI